METKGSAKNQYLGVFCHLLVALGFGAACGWASPSIPILKSEKAPLPTGPIDDQDATWIASILSIGAIGGLLVYGWAIEVFGRKVMSILMGLPQIVKT